MPETDELHEEIKNLRKELRGVGKPWYVRSPFKEIIAHAATATTAVGLSLVVHKWTGAPVVIEAKNDAEPAVGVPVVERPAASALAATTAVLDLDAALVANDPPQPPPPPKAVAAPAVKRKKVVVVDGLDQLAYAPAPAAPAAAAGAPAAPPAPSAAKKVIVLDEIQVGGRVP
jgi:hypothetical protein